jgi:hypothetical protein
VLREWVAAIGRPPKLQSWPDSTYRYLGYLLLFWIGVVINQRQFFFVSPDTNDDTSW